MANELDLGGSERQITEIAKALDRSRFEPHVGCLRPNGMRARELAAAGVPIAHFPVYSFASPGALRSAWRLARYMRLRNIRLLHTFDYPSTIFGVATGRFLTSALILSSQRSHRQLIPRIKRPLVRMTDRLVNAIVVNCEYARSHLEQDEHVPAHRIQLCYNGIDLEEFQPMESPRPPALPLGALVIGVVCALRPEKGVPTLLEAFALVRRTPADLKLAIVGSGPMLESLECQASDLGIRADCLFAPATERVADWLRAIDIFVLPSRLEALSNSLMEAMACGCPVVASNVGGNPELVRGGETGLLFEAGDAAGLGSVLETLIASEPLRKRIGQAAAQSMHDRFSARASAARMGQIYAGLIEPSASSP
jgi:glycosyltransferase involved in cell wall biosynthesis